MAAVVIATTAALTAAIAANAATQSALAASGHSAPIWVSVATSVCYGSVIVVALLAGLWAACRWARERCSKAVNRWCTRA